VRWRPESAAANYRPLPDAPAVANSATKRLLQMKSLAARFAASDEFKISSTDKETTRHELRLLPTPIYRYESAVSAIDGAVFAFVHGTDPELFLVLEHTASEQPPWRYSLAPMTCWAVEAKLDGRIVWNVPERLGKSTPSDSYHVWIHQPRP
jgi:hypothetical protein